MPDAPRLPHDWIVPAWPAHERVRGFVTTRQGGVSASPFDTLNLGYGGTDRPHDDRAAVQENRRRVQQYLPAAPTWLRQVHGTTVAIVDALPADAPVADAAVTRATNVPLVVMVADCLPVLLAARDGSVVGLAHAGWRGLAAGVIERTLEAMGCAPQEVVAWLGPSIGPDAFEVGADVYAAFVDAEAGAATCFRAVRAGKWLADLPGLAHRRLAAAGVRDAHGGTWCTVRAPTRFYSYRRDGPSGRMAAFLWLAGP